MSLPRHAWLLALTLLLPAVASADITITSSLNNYRITVIDLTPDDNLAAGWQYTAARSRFMVGDEPVTTPYTPQPSQAPYHKVHDSFYHQSVDSTGFNQGEVVTTFGTPLQQLPPELNNAILDFESRILIAPHTRLVVEVDFRSTTRSTGGDHFLLGGAQYAILSSGGNSASIGYDKIYYHGEDESRVLSITLDNKSAGSLASRVWLYAANTVMFATPVPEPASYAMLGLGLGLLALRRQRSWQSRMRVPQLITNPFGNAKSIG
jgi:hypothetical protein